MQQWEYVNGHKPVGVYEIDYLNKLGKDGWQLCAVSDSPHRITIYYFKRPIQQPSTVEKIFNEVKNEVGGGSLCA